MAHAQSNGAIDELRVRRGTKTRVGVAAARWVANAVSLGRPIQLMRRVESFEIALCCFGEFIPSSTARQDAAIWPFDGTRLTTSVVIVTAESFMKSSSGVFVCLVSQSTTQTTIPAAESTSEQAISPPSNMFLSRIEDGLWKRKPRSFIAIEKHNIRLHL